MISHTMIRIALAGALLNLFGLAGCGFQPVYGPELRASGGSAVAISEIPGRTGHALRRALVQETANGLAAGAEGAVLTVSLDESIQRLGFRPDGAAFRASYRVQGAYVLEMPDAAISGRESSEVFFSVPDATFGDIAAQADAGERAAGLLARRIVEDIRLQLTPSE